MSDEKRVPVPQELEVLANIQKNIIARAWADPKFAEQLKKNPTAVAREVYGVELPANLKLVVIEDTPTTRHIVLPQRMEMPAGDELSDTQLEAVSGGKSVGGLSPAQEAQRDQRIQDDWNNNFVKPWGG